MDAIVGQHLKNKRLMTSKPGLTTRFPTFEVASPVETNKLHALDDELASPTRSGDEVPGTPPKHSGTYAVPSKAMQTLEALSLPPTMMTVPEDYTPGVVASLPDDHSGNTQHYQFPFLEPEAPAPSSRSPTHTGRNRMWTFGDKDSVGERRSSGGDSGESSSQLITEMSEAGSSTANAEYRLNIPSHLKKLKK